MAYASHAEPAASIAALHRKIAGERLTRDPARHHPRRGAGALFEDRAGGLVVATQQTGLDRDEVLHLSEAMIAVGRRLDWGSQVRGGPVVDKHCIGGMPGNRTSMLVVPIVTAHGMLCPKTSSRAITSPPGTADTMEVLAEVALLFERLAAIVRETNGCLAWGGTADLSPADDILISVEAAAGTGFAGPDDRVDPVQEDRRRLHPPGAGYPDGPHRQGAHHGRGAQRLKKLFEFVAARLNLQPRCLDQ